VVWSGVGVRDERIDADGDLFASGGVNAARLNEASSAGDGQGFAGLTEGWLNQRQGDDDAFFVGGDFYFHGLYV
jgi:hypothetical protein